MTTLLNSQNADEYVSAKSKEWFDDELDSRLAEKREKLEDRLSDERDALVRELHEELKYLRPQWFREWRENHAAGH